MNLTDSSGNVSVVRVIKINERSFGHNFVGEIEIDAIMMFNNLDLLEGHQTPALFGRVQEMDAIVYRKRVAGIQQMGSKIRALRISGV